MKLNDIAKAVAAVKPNHSILIYSRPKMGKTRLAGTAARIKEVRRIFWFDGENGMETLLHMDLTEEEMEKITLFKIRDTKDEPIFIETMLKAFTEKKGIYICDMHGRVDCAACKRAGFATTFFKMTDCTHNDLIILDSGSQLGDSAMAALCLGRDNMFKPGWDEFGIQGKWLGDILTVVQQATFTNFVFLTHEICVETDEKKDEFFPLMGTKNFSMKCGKYFGTVVYLHKKLNKHVAGSSSTYLGDRITGSRVNACIEKSKEMSMRSILIDGGILKEDEMSSEPVEDISSKIIPMENIPVSNEDKNKPLSLAERLAQKAADKALKKAAEAEAESKGKSQ